MSLILSFIFSFFGNRDLQGQEYKSMRHYRALTGKDTLVDGVWLIKDRKLNTAVWQKANEYNLQLEKGHKKYTTISQIRDFYKWFDNYRIKKGHEIRYIGIAEKVASQLAILDRPLIGKILVRDKNVLNFAGEASKKVFAFAFEKMKEVYVMKDKLLGSAAENWDYDYGRNEQCVVLDPIYDKLPPESIIKLERMARGQGIYRFGVPGDMKFEGDIKNCEDRILHALKKIRPHLEKIRNSTH